MILSKSLLCAQERASSAATEIYHVFKFGCYATGLLGATMADSFVGRKLFGRYRPSTLYSRQIPNNPLYWHGLLHRAGNGTEGSRANEYCHIWKTGSGITEMSTSYCNRELTEENNRFGMISLGTQEMDQQWINLSNCILPGLGSVAPRGAHFFHIIIL